MNYDFLQIGPGRNAYDEHRHRVLLQMNLRFRLRDTLNPFEMSTTEFVCLYRMPQHCVFEIAEILRPYMVVRHHPRQIPLVIKVLCAIGFYACGSYQRVLGRMCDLSLSQSTVSNALNEVTRAFNHPDVIHTFIKFPSTAETREVVMERNFEKLGWPRLLGLLDGTFVKIVPPPRHLNGQAYYCRKGFPGLNVVIVCDADLRIMYVNARFPASANDPYIWGVLPLRNAMIEAYRESRCWLLGDSAYPLEPWLFPPLVHAAVGTPEYYYTKFHSRVRNAVERAIGVLKARWRCLLQDRTLHYRPEKAGLIVNACVCLHNFCLARGARGPQPIFEDYPVDEFIQPPGPLPAAEAARLRLARAERQHLINYAYNMHLANLDD